MKIFSREFWGSVLIWFGILIFIVVLYDAVRPYFPDRSRYPAVADIQRSIQSLFSGGATGTDKPPPPRNRPSRPPRRPPANLENGMLTNAIHQTGGNYHLWVWEILPERKLSDTIVVEIAHAAAGKREDSLLSPTPTPTATEDRIRRSPGRIS